MEETAHLTAQATHEWGKLLFLGKDGQPAEHYTISKNTVVLGRLDPAPASTCTARTLMQSGSQHLQSHWLAVPSNTPQLPLKRLPIAFVLWEFHKAVADWDDIQGQELRHRNTTEGGVETARAPGCGRLRCSVAVQHG